MMSFELIVKYLSGKASPDEAIRIDEWIDASSENRDHFNGIQSQWLSAGGETMRIPDVQASWKKFEATITKPAAKPAGGKVIMLRRFAVAASLVGVCFLAYFLYNNKLGGMQTAEAGNEVIEIGLPDGSEVRLFEQGKLSYPSQFASSNREVKLEGDAFFMVNPDKSKPFIIDAGNCKVQVLGTIFDVRHEKNMTVVTVVSGRVKVFNKLGEVILGPGQSASCEGNNAVKMIGDHEVATKTTVAAADNAVSTGSFDFTDKPLKEVVSQLSSHFKTEITLEDPALGDCRLTAPFTDETLENIVEVIALTLNIDSRNENGKIIFSGNACK